MNKKGQNPENTKHKPNRRRVGAGIHAGSGYTGADHANSMTCVIDGVPVRNLESYRVQSPLFTYGPLPGNNILESFGLDAPAGSTSPSASDGVFIMLAPLSAGSHTIHFTGALTLSVANGDPFDLDFRLDITYHLTVAPGSH